MTLTAWENKETSKEHRRINAQWQKKELLLQTIGLISELYERANKKKHYHWSSRTKAVAKLLVKQSQVLVQLKNLSNHDVLKLSSTYHEAFAELSLNCHQELTSNIINLKGVFILQSMSWMFGMNLTFLQFKDLNSTCSNCEQSFIKSMKNSI